MESEPPAEHAEEAVASPASERASQKEVRVHSARRGRKSSAQGTTCSRVAAQRRARGSLQPGCAGRLARRALGPHCRWRDAAV